MVPALAIAIGATAETADSTTAESVDDCAIAGDGETTAAWALLERDIKQQLIVDMVPRH